MQRVLKVAPGETTPDGEFSYETVNCLGACALGPLLTADEEFHGNMTVARLDKLIKKLAATDGETETEVSS
jgi:NADH-quinone oxidoreductase subunit E